MVKKVIDPQPIIDNLTTRYLSAKGMECSILGEVIEMLRFAPDEAAGTSFVSIDGVHINGDQIRSFAWHDGELCVWYAGRHFFESWKDPDRKLYKDLCYVFGVVPTEDPEV